MNRPLRVLVTGFGRFPGAPVNPTANLARALAARRRPGLGDLAPTVRVLPTTWEAVRQFDAVLDATDPDIVLMLGLAARRRHICIETRAINAASRSPDASRQHAAGRVLAVGGKPAIGCTCAPVPLVRALREARLPARASRDAGRYLCNALAYRVYGHAQATGRPCLAVFVHIPRLHHCAGADMRRGLEGLLIALAAQFRASPSR